MKTLALLALVLGTGLATAEDKAEMKALTGTWVMEKFEMEGSDLSESFKGTELVIDGEKYAVEVNKMKDAGTLKVDGSKTPKTMDITGTEGPNKGKTFLCIYEVKDGKLTICYSLDEKVRPTKFESPKDSKTLLAVYKKK